MWELVKTVRGGADLTSWRWPVTRWGVSLVSSVEREGSQVVSKCDWAFSGVWTLISRPSRGTGRPAVRAVLLGLACCLVLTDAPGNYCYYTMIDAMIYKLGYLHLQPHRHTARPTPRQALYPTTTTTRDQLKKTPSWVRKYFGSLPKCNNRI